MCSACCSPLSCTGSERRRSMPATRRSGKAADKDTGAADVKGERGTRAPGERLELLSGPAEDPVLHSSESVARQHLWVPGVDVCSVRCYQAADCSVWCCKDLRTCRDRQTDLQWLTLPCSCRARWCTQRRVSHPAEHKGSLERPQWPGGGHGPTITELAHSIRKLLFASRGVRRCGRIGPRTSAGMRRP